MSDKLDDLLKNALAPSEEPSVWLNMRIIQIAKGDITMRKPFFKSARVAIAAVAAVLAAGSITTYAAWKYLSMDEVAKEVNDDKLAKAFQGKDAIYVNESQTYGKYKVTLIGITSGKDLSEYYMTDGDGTKHENRTYAVTAIENKDGTPMSEDSAGSNFLVTPLIKGEKPWQCNIFYMNGGASSFVKDGILYYLSEWDNFEAFAKRGVYLGVLDSTFLDNTVYDFDEKTGEITRNNDYKGMNVLFTVPMDTSKADEAAADALLKKWQEDAERDDSENSDAANGEPITDAFEEEAAKWDIDRIQKEAVLVKDSVKTVKADKDGMLNYSWKWNGYEGSGAVSEDIVFKKGQTGMSEYFNTTNGNGEKDLIFETYCRNEDGTVTISIYHTKGCK